MIDRNSIPLAEGSRWDGDRIVDEEGYSIRVATGIDGKFLRVDTGETCTSIHDDDAIAALTAAGLNPYAEALERLLDAILRERTLNSEMDPMRFSNEIGADCIQDELDAANKLLGRT